MALDFAAGCAGGKEKLFINPKYSGSIPAKSLILSIKSRQK